MNGSPWLQLVPFLIVLPYLGGIVWGVGRIAKKTGRSPYLGILFLVPLVNLWLLASLALSEWPIELEIKRLRESVAVLQGIREL